MAINPLYNSSAVRLMGLSSGMDTDSIVQKTLRLHQMKIDSQFRSRTMLEWKQQALGKIKDDITNFRWSFLTTLGSNAMRLSSVYNSTVATVSGKNSGAVSIATSTSSSLGTLKIGQIESLAKATSISSASGVSRDGAGLKLTDKLSTAMLSNREIQFDSKGNANVNFNGTEIVLNKYDSLNIVNEKIRQKGGNQIVFYDDQVNYEGRQYARVNVNGKSVTVYKDEAYEYENNIFGKEAVTNALLFAGSQTTGSFDINGKPATLEAGDTVRDMLTRAGISENDLVWTTMNNSSSIKYAMVTVNDKEVALFDFQLDSKASGEKQITDAIIFGGDDKVNVSVNGAAIDLGRYDSFEDINAKIVAGGGTAINFSGGTNSPKYAEIEINGVDHIKVFQDEIPKNSFVSGLTDKANETGLGGMSFNADGKAYITVGNGSVNATIELNKDMTIQDMLSAVNATGLGITMKYDRLSDQFTVEANKAGASTITVGGLTALGIYNGTYKNGTLARVQINGQWVESNSNTFDYRGLKITLNETTAGSGPAGVDLKPAWTSADDITVTLKRDATEPLNKIKSFVEAYNTLIKKLEDMLAERKTSKESAYKPLTDEEKSLMSDKQIEEWEAIAKKGLFKNDSGIQTLSTSLRGALYDKIKEAGLSPSQIGISTGRWDEGTGGQILLDENKLRAALEEDPDKVMNIFMGGADSKKYEDRGLLWRMDDIMLGYINGSQSTSLTNLENSIKKSNEQIERLQKKMYDEEDRLYKKFAAMETALSKVQSQSDWLTSMLNTGNGKK